MIWEIKEYWHEDIMGAVHNPENWSAYESKGMSLILQIPQSTNVLSFDVIPMPKH
jgi:hypothetical protein